MVVHRPSSGGYSRARAMPWPTSARFTSRPWVATRSAAAASSGRVPRRPSRATPSIRRAPALRAPRWPRWRRSRRRPRVCRSPGDEPARCVRRRRPQRVAVGHDPCHHDDGQHRPHGASSFGSSCHCHRRRLTESGPASGVPPDPRVAEARWMSGIHSPARTLCGRRLRDATLRQWDARTDSAGQHAGSGRKAVQAPVVGAPAASSDPMSHGCCSLRSSHGATPRRSIRP